MSAVSSSSDGSEYSEDFVAHSDDPTVRVPDAQPIVTNGDVNVDEATAKKPSKKRHNLAAVVRATQAAKTLGGGSKPLKPYNTSFGRLLGEGWRFGVSVAREKARRVSEGKPSALCNEEKKDEKDGVITIAEDKGGDGSCDNEAASNPTMQSRPLVDTNTLGPDTAVQDVMWNAFSEQAARAASRRMPTLSTVHALNDMAADIKNPQGSSTTGQHGLDSDVKSASAPDAAGMVAEVMVKALQQIMGQQVVAPQTGISGPVITSYSDMTKGYNHSGNYHGRVQPTHWNGGRDTSSRFNDSGLYGHFPGDELTNTRQDWRGQYDRPQGYPHRSSRRSRSAPHISQKHYNSHSRGMNSSSEQSAYDERRGMAHRSRKRETRQHRARSADGRSRHTGGNRRENADPFTMGILQDVVESEQRAKDLAAAVSSSDDTSLSECESVPLQRLEEFMRRSSAATSAGARKRSKSKNRFLGESRIDTSGSGEMWFDTELNQQKSSRKDAIRNQAMRKRNAYDRSSAAVPSTSSALLPKPLVSGVLPSAATLGALSLNPKSLLGESDSDFSISLRGTTHRNSHVSYDGVLTSDDGGVSPHAKSVLPVPLKVSSAVSHRGHHMPPKSMHARFINLRATDRSMISPTSSADLSSQSGGANRYSTHANDEDDDDGHNFSDSTRSSDSFRTVEDHVKVSYTVGPRPKAAKQKNSHFVDLDYTAYGPTYSDYEPSTPTLSPHSSVDQTQNYTSQVGSDCSASDGESGSGTVPSGSESEFESFHSEDDLNHSEQELELSVESSTDYKVSDSHSESLESSVDSGSLGEGIAGVLRNMAEANRSRVHVDRTNLKLWRPNQI